MKKLILFLCILLNFNCLAKESEMNKRQIELWKSETQHLFFYEDRITKPFINNISCDTTNLPELLKKELAVYAKEKPKAKRFARAENELFFDSEGNLCEGIIIFIKVVMMFSKIVFLKMEWGFL